MTDGRHPTAPTLNAIHQPTPQITTQPLTTGDAAPDAPTTSTTSGGEAYAAQPRSLRTRCFINGALTSMRVLRAVGAALVDTNGQHAAVGLRDSDTQLALLDRIAGELAQADGGLCDGGLCNWVGWRACMSLCGWIVMGGFVLVGGWLAVSCARARGAPCKAAHAIHHYTHKPQPPPITRHPLTPTPTPPGNSHLAAALAARQSRLAQITDSLKGLDALGDESERARIEKLVNLVNRARVEPGEERRLRGLLRSMEARRSSLEQVGRVGG